MSENLRRNEWAVHRRAWAGWPRLVLLAILVFGFALRLYRLDAQSIWYDESVSLLLASKSLPAMIAHTAGDIHPPLYYALLHGWLRLAGSSEFAAGFFSLFFGVLLIVLLYYWGKVVLNPVAGLVAAFLVAISPFHVWYSQEVRMYTLGACLGLVAMLGLWLAWKDGARRALGWGVYLIAAVAGLYTLYYFVFLLIALNAWALLAFAGVSPPLRGRLLKWWGVTQLGVLALYAPWLPIAYRQATDPPVPPWREFTPWGKMAIESWTALSFGHSIEPAHIWPLLLLTFALAIVGLWALIRVRWTYALLVGGFLLIPLGLMAAFSLWTPLYHVRYVFTYSPAFYLLVAAGLTKILPMGRETLGMNVSVSEICSASQRARYARMAAFMLSLAAIIAGSALSLWQYHHSPTYAPDDHRAAVRYLNERWRPGDTVLVNAGYVYPAVLYYNRLPVAWRGRLIEYGRAFARDQAPAGLVLLQTGSIGGSPRLGWGSAASDFYATSYEETIEALERVFRDYERVWVYRCYDTVTDPQGLIRAWLEEHGRKFEEPPAFAGLSHMRVQGYLTARGLTASLPAGTTPAGVVYNGRLELAAIEGSASLEAGQPLYIALWWRPRVSPLPRLAITVRLVDAAGRMWAQVDEQPLGSSYDASAWAAGQLVRHPIRLDLPHGLLPVPYRLMVGVYEADSGIPWPTEHGEQLAPVLEMRSAGEVLPMPSVKPAAIFENLIELGQAQVDPWRVQAGYSAHLTLTWRARQAIGEDLILFVQALDSQGKLVAAQESPPAGGLYSTSQWVAGQVIRDQLDLHVPADTAPGRYRLILGLYCLSNRERLRVESFWPWARRDYWPLGTLEVYSRTPQLTPPVQPAHASGARFGAGIELTGYDVDAVQARPGGHVGVRLLWHVVGPIERDYAVFCHLVDEHGTIVAQADGVPAEGTMPTLTWMAGEYIVDTHIIPLREDVPAGEYRLLVGLYDRVTHERPGEPAVLGTVTMLP